MSGAFETNVELLCFSSLEAARRNVAQLAAVCGGVVVEVGRIEVAGTSVTFQGLASRMVAGGILGRVCDAFTSSITSIPSSSCSLSTTWSNIVNPEKILGFLVINDFGQVSKTTTVEEWNEELGQPDTILCRLCFERVLFSLPAMFHGVSYCEACGCQIPEKRVLAIPNVRRCVMCQAN